MNCMGYTFYIILMAKCMCARLGYLLKLLPSNQACCCHVLIQVSWYDFMLRIICMFLGCDLPIQLLLKLLSSEYYIRLKAPVTMY